MTATYQFRLVTPPPDDSQVRRIHAFADAPTVELAPEEQTGAVWFDRRAPTLAGAVVSAALDLERVGLRLVRVEPRHLATVAEAAARLDRPTESLQAALTSAPPGPDTPAPYKMRATGPEPMFDWDDIASWVRGSLGVDVPDDGVILHAASLALRLRQCVQGLTGAESLVHAVTTAPR